MPALFQDPIYKESTNWTLSTSTLPSEYFNGLGYGAGEKMSYGNYLLAETDSFRLVRCDLSCTRRIRAGLRCQRGNHSVYRHYYQWERAPIETLLTRGCRRHLHDDESARRPRFARCQTLTSRHFRSLTYGFDQVSSERIPPSWTDLFSIRKISFSLYVSVSRYLSEGFLILFSIFFLRSNSFHAFRLYFYVLPCNSVYLSLINLSLY
jgi:hypothetical protein